MSTDDVEPHQLLGAFILGGLDADEHRAFTRHLRGCTTCQSEAAQFSGLPALLDLVSPDPTTGLSAPGQPAVPHASETTVPVALLDAVRLRRRTRRLRLAVAAVVLALAAAGLGAGIGPFLNRVNAPPTSRVVAAPERASQAAVEISLVTRAWGTQLDLVGSGLPTKGTFYLWVTNKAGRSWSVASWTGIPSGRATLSAACWVRPDEIGWLQVRQADGTPLATATV